MFALKSFKEASLFCGVKLIDCCMKCIAGSAATAKAAQNGIGTYAIPMISSGLLGCGGLDKYAVLRTAKIIQVINIE